MNISTHIFYLNSNTLNNKLCKYFKYCFFFFFLHVVWNPATLNIALWQYNIDDDDYFLILEYYPIVFPPYICHINIPF